MRIRLCVFLALVFFAAPAAQCQFDYTTTNGGVTITDYTGSGGVVTIPATINNLPVTSIGASAFFFTSVTSVTIPSGVTNIGAYAFEDCAILASIYFLGNTPSYGEYAFETHSGGDTTAYYYPGTSGWDSFFAVPSAMLNEPSPAGSLQVTITPDGAIAAGAQWYVDGGIPQPGGATVLGLTASNHLVSFSSVRGWITPASQLVFVSANLIASAAGVYVPTQFGYTTNNGSLTVTYYTGPGGAVIIPSTIDNLPVTGIGASAFSNRTDVTSVTIGANVTSIGVGAFEGCSGLVAVYFDGSAPSAGPTAFAGDTNATAFYLPDTTGWAGFSTNTGILTEDEYGYVTNAGAITITRYSGPGGVVAIPQTITGLPVASIGDAAFFYLTNLTTVTIPDGVLDIGDSAFQNCFNLASVTVPAGVTNLGSGAFEDASLTNLTIPDSVTTIGEGTFEFCPLTSVTIPGSVTTIGNDAFSGCALTNVTLGEGIASIGDVAFSDCELTSVTIPASVTNIGVAPFEGCPGLTAITVDPNNAFYLSVAGVLLNRSQTTLIEYPPAKSGTSYAIPGSVTNIGAGAFDSSASLTSVGIPDGVVSIGAAAFDSCTNLASVAIPASVISIGNFAFNYCLNLTNATLLEGIATLGGYAFTQCDLSRVTIPDSVTNVGQWAFAYCTNLTRITIPNGVTSLGNYALYQCYRLTSATIGNSLTSVGESAFDGCVSLSNLIIGNSVTSIGYAAFSGCTSLAGITIPNSVTSIADYAFWQCTGLTSVTIPEGVTNIGVAFGDCDNLTSAYFEGNAPAGNADPFYFDNNVTVYYLRGTTGWDPNFWYSPTMELPAITITANPTNGVIPLKVNFTSAGVDSAGNAVRHWNWVFGDGSASTAQNPSHTYTSAGTFNVALVETNNNNVLTAGSAVSITTSPRTVAFTANPTNGVVPLAVSFNAADVDSAGNAITSWNWMFGDGSTSTAQNPSHTYTSRGTFFPLLIATNNLGDTVTGSGPASIKTSAAPVYSGLVLNGGFETGDFTGWSLSGPDTNGIFVDDGSISGIQPHSGTDLAALGSEGSLDFLSQTLATTPGSAYLLSFWLNSPDGLIPNEFLVSWAGQTLFDEANLGQFTGWTNLQFRVVATGTTTVLQFGSRDDNSYLGLDDISVVPVQPGILGVSVAGANLVLSGTNGLSGGTYYLLTSTNLALPLSEWTAIATNLLGVSGDFTLVASNAVARNIPRRFYILQAR